MLGFTPKWNEPLLITSGNPAADDRASLLESARLKAILALEKAAGIMKHYYDAKRDDLPPLAIGSKVWIEGTNITPFRPMKKLAEKRYGPFEVLEQNGPSAYKLALPPTWKGVHPVFNETLLSPFHEPLPGQSIVQPPPVQGDAPDSYEVEAILDSRKRRKKIQYLVKWLGYGHEENTWEPIQNLKDAKEALALFRENRRAPQ